jgi:acetyl esterase/lipase
MNCPVPFAIAGIVLASHLAAAEAAPVLDVAYRQGMSAPTLDFFAPATKGFPTLVYVYGSGWRSGSGKSSTPIAEALRRHGIACVLVSHRLAPAQPIPGQADDVAAAFAWAKTHVAENGGDPQKVFLGGHSTGGHLSVLVASDPKFLAAYHLASTDIAGVIGLSAPVDLAPHADGHGYGNLMAGPRGKGVFPADPAEVAAVSPLQRLGHQLPRTLLLVGSEDFPMLAADARAFAQKAESFGTVIATEVISGNDHMGMVRGLTAESDPVFKRVVAFIELNKTAKPPR